MKLHDFIKLQDPAGYDFKNEINDAESNPWLKKHPELKEIAQMICDAPDYTLDKILLYKNTYKTKHTELTGSWEMFDCDCSPLMNEIYTRLWGCVSIKNGTVRYTMGEFQNAADKAQMP
jgi:hypothetical protein